MPKNTIIIAHAPIARHMRASTTLRLSKPGLALLSKHLTEYAKQISKQATLNAQHAARLTVLANDVYLVK
jgi:histone H3/H4